VCNEQEGLCNGQYGAWLFINNEGTDISFVSKWVGPIKDGTPMVFSFVTMLIGPIKDSTPMKEADSVR